MRFGCGTPPNSPILAYVRVYMHACMLHVCMFVCVYLSMYLQPGAGFDFSLSSRPPTRPLGSLTSALRVRAVLTHGGHAKLTWLARTNEYAMTSAMRSCAPPQSVTKTVCTELVAETGLSCSRPTAQPCRPRQCRRSATARRLSKRHTTSMTPHGSGTRQRAERGLPTQPHPTSLGGSGGPVEQY